MTFHRIAGPHISWEEFHAEYVVLDLETGRYFNLAAGAALVWTGLLDGLSSQMLAAELAPGGAEQLAFEQCLAAMTAARLIVATDTTAPTGAAASASDLAAQLLASGTDYRFEAFDDLAELLTADPIHDVQAEAGWPHLPS